MCTAASNAADSAALGGQLRQSSDCVRERSGPGPVNNDHQIVMGWLSLVRSRYNPRADPI